MNEVQQPKVFEAVSKVMADLKAIGKNQSNRSQGFKFRGIDDVYNAVQPLMAKHKVFTTPRVVHVDKWETQTRSGSTMHNRMVTMEYTFYGQDGSHFTAVVCGEGTDMGDKATNKAMAIAHKYALLQVLAVPTDDVIDPDSESHETGTAKKKAPAKPKVVSFNGVEKGKWKPKGKLNFEGKNRDVGPAEIAQQKMLKAKINESPFTMQQILGRLKKDNVNSLEELPWSFIDELKGFLIAETKYWKGQA